MLKASKALISILVLLLILTACGANNNAQNSNNTDNASKNNEQPANTNEPKTDSRTIKDSVGDQVIEGTPQKVVVLEWTYAEDVLALGVQPVGMADIKNYNSWVNVEPKLADTVKDVGTRQEPSLEIIASLEPDLIIGVSFRHKAIFDQLKAIAPTLLFDPYPLEGTVTQYEEMEQTFLAIADALNKQDEGKAVLVKMNATFEKAKADLKAAGKEGAEFVLTQAFTSQEVPAFRLFTDNGMATEILTKLGMKNVVKAAKFESYGFTNGTVEALPALQQAHLLYVVQDTDNIFENQLKENNVWKNLAFVKENKTYALGGDTWLFGGPLSAEVFANKVVSVLTK